MKVDDKEFALREISIARVTNVFVVRHANTTL